jgi:heme exporter protein B
VLWVIFTFSGLLGLNRSFGLELAERAYDGLLASQVSRESVFAGKVLGNLVFVCGIQLLTLPAVVLFFDLPVGGAWLLLLVILLLASLGSRRWAPCSRRSHPTRDWPNCCCP